MTGAAGWRRIGPDPRLLGWVAEALPVAQGVLAASDAARRCGGTWFVGVDALPNGPDGGIGQTAFPWAALPLAPVSLHRAQLSVVAPGYPLPSAEEDEAAYRFRQRRDAAHLDGLLPVGPDRRRMVKEPHGWILGLPLNACGAGASPLVVWEGSHEVMRAALRAAFRGHDPALWGDLDITAAYKAARAEVFRHCRRVELPAQPGEATLLHRLAVHGVAPWAEGAEAPPEGRIIAYFRPQMGSVVDWLDAE
ncbi:MAG: hypothetical protein WAS26_02395 [Paracoccaceae bacterium]